MRIAITTSSFAEFSEDPLELLKKAGIKFSINPLGRKLAPEETVEQLAGCAGVVAGTEELSAKIMDRLPDLKVISRCGVGMDSVDMDAAKARDIQVVNTPFGPTRAVAELALGLALDLARQVTRMDRELRAGTWKKRMGNLIQGKTLGVVGMGRIGRATAELFTPLGVTVVYHDPVADCPGYQRLSLEELLTRADIVTLHCSKPAQNCALMGADELAAMKPGSWLINCGRGGLVDEDALYQALESGHLAGAAVDCFESEPYKGRLAERDTAILTPHVGSYAREGRIQMEIDSVKNLIEALKAGE